MAAVTALAAVMAALAAMVVVPPSRSALLVDRLGGRATMIPPRPGAADASARRSRVVIGVLIGALAGGALAGPVGAAAGAAAPPVGVVWWRRRRRERDRLRRETDVEEACLALAGELGAGVPARHALAAVADDWPELFAAASGRAMVGGDPAQALRGSAGRPGAEALTAVAAAWEVSERSGAGLSTVLLAVAESLRTDGMVRREAQAQLSSVRATSRLMAVLPVATLALFSAGDRSAIDFLTRSAYGLVCLALTVVFIAAGLFWVDRAARSVPSAWRS